MNIKKLVVFFALLFVLVSAVSFIPSRAVVYISSTGEPLKKLLAEVTAYTSSPEETDDTPTITASGTTTRPGTAACPAFLEFGSRVKIGGEMYICEDRMAERYRHGHFFDIWMPEKAEAYEFGRQELVVLVYN